MLFLLRKTGLLRHNDLIKETRNLLTENNYSIDQEGLVTIKDKKEFLNKLYNKKMDDEEFSKNINSANSNMCYFFITDYTDYKTNLSILKTYYVPKYPNPDNKHWNYIHSSDNVKEARKRKSNCCFQIH